METHGVFCVYLFYGSDVNWKQTYVIRLSLNYDCSLNCIIPESNSDGYDQREMIYHTNAGTVKTLSDAKKLRKF